MEKFIGRLTSLSTRFAKFNKNATYLTLPVGRPLADNLEKIINLIGSDVSFSVEGSKVVDIIPCIKREIPKEKKG
jgi:hypothetical protein